jgi:hypothetical protein
MSIVLDLLESIECVFDTKIFVDPSRSELIALFNEYPEIRATRGIDGTLYAWNAYKLDHSTVKRSLGILTTDLGLVIHKADAEEVNYRLSDLMKIKLTYVAPDAPITPSLGY